MPASHADAASTCQQLQSRQPHAYLYPAAPPVSRAAPQAWALQGLHLSSPVPNSASDLKPSPWEASAAGHRGWRMPSQLFFKGPSRAYRQGRA